MKKNNLILLLLITTLFGCDNVDKIKKTEEIVKQIDAQKDGDFFIEASIEDDKSHLSVKLKYNNFLAYYTGSLYDIIMELHKNKIIYDEYDIKNEQGEIVWSVKDSEIENITETINQSKKLINLLERKEYIKFLSFTNFKTLGISDSVFLASIKENPIYPNTTYKGFSIIEKEINNVKEEFFYIYFMNDELKENLIVLSPKDKLVYGLEY